MDDLDLLETGFRLCSKRVQSVIGALLLVALIVSPVLVIRPAMWLIEQRAHSISNQIQRSLLNLQHSYPPAAPGTSQPPH